MPHCRIMAGHRRPLRGRLVPGWLSPPPRNTDNVASQGYWQTVARAEPTRMRRFPPSQRPGKVRRQLAKAPAFTVPKEHRATAASASACAADMQHAASLAGHEDHGTHAVGLCPMQTHRSSPRACPGMWVPASPEQPRRQRRSRSRGVQVTVTGTGHNLPAPGSANDQGILYTRLSRRALRAGRLQPAKLSLHASGFLQER